MRTGLATASWAPEATTQCTRTRPAGVGGGGRTLLRNVCGGANRAGGGEAIPPCHGL